MNSIRSLISYAVFSIVLLLSSDAFSHDGEQHDKNGPDQGGHVLFDEGSGSSAFGEYNKKQATPGLKDEKNERDQLMPAYTSPEKREEGSGSSEYNRYSSPKHSGEKFEEEGSGSIRTSPSN